MAQQYKEYVCTLDDASLKKAKEELNEDPKDRMNAVENFRKLIKERPYITCSLETEFLLRFLRVAKFSQLEAMKRLESYLELFNTMPEWLRDIDLMDPKIQEFFDVGYFYLLGFNDKGQRVMISNEGGFDPTKPGFSKTAMMKAMFGVMVHMMMDENTVVNGITGMADLTHFSVKHQMFWTVDDMKKQSAMMNGAWPARWKGYCFYNHGPVFEVLWNMFRPFLKKKMKDRLTLCGSNLEAIYDTVIPMKLLPVEYLPDDYTGPNNGSVNDLIKSLKNEMSKPEVVAKVKYETSDAFRLDESKRPKNEAPLQSFRKLNVD